MVEHQAFDGCPACPASHAASPARLRGASGSTGVRRQKVGVMALRVALHFGAEQLIGAVRRRSTCGQAGKTLLVRRILQTRADGHPVYGLAGFGVRAPRLLCCCIGQGGPGLPAMRAGCTPGVRFGGLSTISPAFRLMCR